MQSFIVILTPAMWAAQSCPQWWGGEVEWGDMVWGHPPCSSLLGGTQRAASPQLWDVAHGVTAQKSGCLFPRWKNVKGSWSKRQPSAFLDSTSDFCWKFFEINIISLISLCMQTWMQYPNQVGPHEGRVEGDKWLHKISILMMHYKERNINSE